MVIAAVLVLTGIVAIVAMSGPEVTAVPSQ
jgi:hypothetical protein